MEYSKLFLVLCFIIALTKAIPVPPIDPATFLEEIQSGEFKNEIPEDNAPANNEVVEDPPHVVEVEAPNYEEYDQNDEPAPAFVVEHFEEPEDEQNQEFAEVPEPVQDEPVQDEPEQDEPVQDEPVQVEPEQVEPVQDEPAQNEPAQDEQIFIDPEADQEPQDISTDTNNVVSENIGNITNDILGSVSFAIKSALEEELGTESNDIATNGLINNVIVDILNKTSDNIKGAVGDILKNDMNNGDNYEQIATNAAEKVADILGHNVITSIASNINFNLDYENISKNVLSSTTKNIQKFIQSNLETSKAVVDQTLTNESSEDMTISNANDIATMVTNGVSYLIKSTLCESLGDDTSDVCDNISNSVIVSVAGVLNDIIKNSVNSANGNGLTIACAAIPSEVFQKLTDPVTNAISSQLNTNNEAESVSKMANNVLTLIINSVENLLCADRAKNNEDESGSIIIKDINGLATHIINKINNMNDDVVSTLRNEKEENQNVSGDIASGISNIQESLKTEVETNGVPEQQPELPQTDEQQPAEEPQQEQPVEEQQEQPVEEQEQPVEEQQEQPVDEQQEQPVDEQQEQLVDEQQINEEGEVNEIVPEKLAFKFVRPANMPVY